MAIDNQDDPFAFMNFEEEETEQTTPDEVEDTAPEEEPISEEPQDEDAKKFIDFLSQYGIVQLNDENIPSSPEEIENLLHTTRQSMYDKAQQDIWQVLPNDFKPLFEYALNGGQSIQEYFEASSLDNALQGIDINDTDNQRFILEQYYRQTSPNLPQEKINKFITKLEEDGDMYNDAAEAYEYLSNLAFQRKEELIQRAAYEEQLRVQQIQEQTRSLANAIDNSTFINQARKDKVKTFFFQPVKVGESQTTGFNYAISNILNNPEHQAQLADLLLDYNPESGFDLRRFEDRVKTRATKNFQELLENKLDPKNKAKGTITRERKSDFDFSKFLDF